MRKKNFRVPKKITPDPIRDSIIEIRFQSETSKEAIFGILFRTLCDEFPLYESNDVPNSLRSYKEFQYAAEGKLKNDDYSVSIGYNVIAFNCINGYKGWDKYFNVIKENLKKIYKTKVINGIDRLGIRYVNLFENIEEVSESLHLNIEFTDKDKYETTQTTFRTEIAKGTFKHILSVADNVMIGETKGTLIDIDTSTTELPNEINDTLFDIINKGRQEEKILFFKLLKENFLAKFNPEY